MTLQNAWDIWHPKLNSVGHQDRAIKTHETVTNRIPIHKAHITRAVLSSRHYCTASQTVDDGPVK